MPDGITVVAAVASLFLKELPLREGFEALVADNLDVGRPDSVELIFTGHKGRRGRLPKVEQVYNTKVVTRQTMVTVNGAQVPLSSIIGVSG